MIDGLLQRFADWALSKNAPGPYKGEDDKRWAYTIETNGDKYLTRIMFPFRILGVRPYLHKFHHPDEDRHLHNHPWRWAMSIILSGSYDEERLEAVLDRVQTTCTRRVRWFNRLTDSDYHRVERLHGEVWTLFITGPKIQD